MGQIDTLAAERHLAVRLIAPLRAAAILPHLRAAGWQVSDDGPVALVDLTDAAAASLALPDTPALLALVGVEPDAAERALAWGATHVHPAADPAGLSAALASAARHVLRLREAEARASGRDERRDLPVAPALWLEQQVAGAGRATVLHVALARLDLLNAAHGREVGTQVVRAAERRIRSAVSALADDDEAAVERIAGPAFLVVMRSAPDLAVLGAARVEEALGRPFRLGGGTVVLGTRIGIAGVREGEAAADLLARVARAGAEEGGDAAGRNDDEIGTLAIDLHHALDRDEIVVLFQPQALLASGRIAGVEALARWQHPERGAIGAAALFRAAEHAGIGLALSEHIQRLVLTRAGNWPAALGDLRVSLNLTAADLARARFAESFLDQLDASGFPRGRLTLEITETGLMADLDVAADLLATLRGAGCRVAIDDFGTGYSSLAYLKSLPIDYLKLDKALAQDIGGSERDRVVVTGAIDMARSLGIAVIAEGVETERQRRLLAEAGCALYQGYLLAEPLDEAGLLALMEQQRCC